MALSINDRLGRLPDPTDDRDLLYRVVVQPTPMTGIRPATFRNSFLGPLLDQGPTPHCVAYATSSAKNRQERIDHGTYLFTSYENEFPPGGNPAPEWLYAECKKIDGFPNVDGTNARAALSVLRTQGLPALNGRQYRIGSYVRISSVEEIAEALYLHGPVLLGIAVDTNWERPGLGGVLGAPNDRVIGGHEVELVGYRDETTFPVGARGFWFKNSWGSSWGAQGYARLPYSHLQHYADWDAWWFSDDPLAELAIT